MLVADEDEMDEKARVLRRKILNNLVGAQLKNEREKERLEFKLKCLGKEEDRQLRQIHRELLQARHILTKTSCEKLCKPTSEETNEYTKDKGKKKATGTDSLNLPTRRSSRKRETQNLRQPRSFLELRRLPPLGDKKSLNDEIRSITFDDDGQINTKTILPEIKIDRAKSSSFNYNEKQKIDSNMNDNIPSALALNGHSDYSDFVFDDISDTTDFYHLDDTLITDPTTSISKALAIAFRQQNMFTDPLPRRSSLNVVSGTDTTNRRERSLSMGDHLPDVPTPGSRQHSRMSLNRTKSLSSSVLRR